MSYKLIIYKAFFNVSEDENSGTVMGSDVIAFVDSVKKLPEVVDRFDTLLIENAITAYNKISDNESEMAYIDASYLAKFNEACSQYNVSVVENKIAHLFDMDMTKYCFDLIKDTRESYLALSDSEKASVSNASVLDTKLEEFKTVWGKDVDFNLTYEENLPEEDDSNTPEPPANPDPSDGLDAWVIILIAVGSVVVIGAVAVILILVSKKKKND